MYKTWATSNVSRNIYNNKKMFFKNLDDKLHPPIFALPNQKALQAKRPEKVIFYLKVEKWIGSSVGRAIHF